MLSPSVRIEGKTVLGGEARRLSPQGIHHCTRAWTPADGEAANTSVECWGEWTDRHNRRRSCVILGFEVPAREFRIYQASKLNMHQKNDRFGDLSLSLLRPMCPAYEVARSVPALLSMQRP